jgi:shikimate kinase
MIMASKVIITETEPTTIIQDFDIFTAYLKENNPPLVRKGHFIMKKTLAEINQQVYTPSPQGVLETSTFLYPYLTLFYALALHSNLFIKTAGLHFKETEKLTEYNQLTTPEKYFFLLETLWVDTNWGFLLYNSHNLLLIPEIQSIIYHLSKISPGKIVPMDWFGTAMNSLLDAHYFLEYMSFFGLLHTVREKDSKPPQRIESAQVTGLGYIFFPILCQEQNILQWNIPYIRQKTEKFVVLPGSTSEPFFKPFQYIFKEELQNTLPRKKYTKGTFTMRVSLRKGLERTIVLSSEHTLEDLHEAIQDAFEFDRDHLYAFFTDGIPWSCHQILAPQDTEGPFADEVLIGELGLVPGQFMKYVFSFGSEWHFKIEILEIIGDKGPDSPVITEKRGKSPEQYPSWD